MKSRNLLIAAALLLVLSGFVWWAKRHPGSSTAETDAQASPKIADILSTNVQQVDITRKGGASLTLKRQDGKWNIVAPQQLPADQDAITTLLGTLSPLNGDSVVEDHPKDLNQYGLTAPTLAVKVYEKNGKTQEFFFGNDIPVGSLTYLRTSSDPKVYAVSGSTKTSLDKSSNDLRDKRLLPVDSNKVSSLELASSNGDYQFSKNDKGDWQIVKPKAYRADSFQLQELVQKLSDAKMDTSSPDDARKTAAEFTSAHPIGTIKITDPSGTQSMQVRKSKDDYLAKSSAVEGTFKLSSDLGGALTKSIDDFRNKKLFDFGFTDLSKIDVTENGATTTYVHSGSDWKSNGHIVDPGKIQAFIDKVRDLAATKFSETPFGTPSATVRVASDNGKRVETVEFVKAGDTYLARRQNEPAIYQLDTNTVKDLLKASAAAMPSKK